MDQQFTSKKKKGVYIQAFQKDEFVKGGDPTITRLLNIPDIEEVSANADALKNSLDKSLTLLNQHSLDENVFKRFISICTDGASTNIGCNDSSYTHLLIEHPHLIAFWCVCHQLELSIKDSVGAGLLNDIKGAPDRVSRDTG